MWVQFQQLQQISWPNLRAQIPAGLTRSAAVSGWATTMWTPSRRNLTSSLITDMQELLSGNYCSHLMMYNSESIYNLPTRDCEFSTIKKKSNLIAEKSLWCKAINNHFTTLYYISLTPNSILNWSDFFLTSGLLIWTTSTTFAAKVPTLCLTLPMKSSEVFLFKLLKPFFIG